MQRIKDVTEGGIIVATTTAAVSSIDITSMGATLAFLPPPSFNRDEKSYR